MKTLKLAGLEVSPLSLGTVNFGTSTPERDAFWQLDSYSELGNFIDTAHVYGDWVPGERALSERVVGKWLKQSGKRGQMVISSKGGHPRLDDAFLPRLSRAELFLDVEESLSCLETDCIDMYFLHRDDVNRPVGEIIDTLEDIKQQGKIRHYGCSNWTLKRIKEAQAYARDNSREGFACNQLMWSLAYIDYEKVKDKTLVCMDVDTYAYHASERLGAMAYMSVAKGYFSHMAAGTVARASALEVYGGRKNDTIFSALTEMSRETGYTVTELSLMYFLNQPFPAVAIASFSKPEQLREGIKLLELSPAEDVIRSVRALRPDLVP